MLEYEDRHAAVLLPALQHPLRARQEQHPYLQQQRVEDKVARLAVRDRDALPAHQLLPEVLRVYRERLPVVVAQGVGTVQEEEVVVEALEIHEQRVPVDVSQDGVHQVCQLQFPEPEEVVKGLVALQRYESAQVLREEEPAV